MLKRQVIILAVALGIIVTAFALNQLFASLKEEPEKKKPKLVRKSVLTRKVNYGPQKTSVVSYGRVQTAQSLDLLSEVAGRMFQGKVPLKEGENFKKGTLLFFIDDEEVALSLKSQKSNFLRDLAGILPDLKVDFSSSFEPWQDYFESLDVDKVFPDLPASSSGKEKTFLATKGIYSSFYAIQGAEVRLQKHRYYAPFDGSITAVDLQSGSFVNPGSRIGRIIRSGLYELKVAVETNEIPWIVPDAEVKIYSEETQQYLDGRVIRISDFVNQNTQSVDVFISLFSNGNRIYDGQFFQAAIPGKTITDGMIIPRSAIYDNNEVFLVEDTVLKVRNVDILKLTEEEAIIAGLPEGSDLVVEPLIGAYNNMPVEKREQKDIDLELGSNSSKGSAGTPENQGSY